MPELGRHFRMNNRGWGIITVNLFRSGYGSQSSVGEVGKTLKTGENCRLKRRMLLVFFQYPVHSNNYGRQIHLSVEIVWQIKQERNRSGENVLSHQFTLRSINRIKHVYYQLEFKKGLLGLRITDEWRIKIFSVMIKFWLPNKIY